MTDYRLTDSQLKTLISEIAERLCSGYFANETHIDGDGILDFCPHQQVNLFILFQIYQEWNIYVSKIQHPYFDFKNAEVRQALMGFQNILSRHVLVSKYDFRSMIEKSLSNTLRLALSPVDSLVSFFFANKESLSISMFEKYSAYFSDYDFVISSILSYHQNAGKDKIDKQVFVQQVEKVLNLYKEKQQFDIDEYRQKLFLAITGKNLQDFLATTATETAFARPPYSMDNIVNDATRSEGAITYFDKLDSFEPAKKQTQSPPAEQQNPMTATVEKTVLNSADKQSNRLADRFVQNLQGATLNDQLRFNKKLTADNIPVHIKFQVLTKVFTGDKALQADTMEELAKMRSSKEAVEYMRTRILNRPGVVKDDPIVLEFMDLIQNQY